MSSVAIIGLAAATLVGIVLVPVDALAHRPIPAIKVCGAADFRGWNAFSRNPGQQGFPGPHYGCDCFRAANGRAICPNY